MPSEATKTSGLVCLPHRMLALSLGEPRPVLVAEDELAAKMTMRSQLRHYGDDPYAAEDDLADGPTDLAEATSDTSPSSLFVVQLL